ncbi:DNA-3-methyladenine glycosylase family protein [Clostridium algidicarnis]|uniref:DNA-3-methyladenine glycosylase family protein n=1 Tax=Clostridium algidicarnis TaxID=37659 RepID=UPI001C0BFA09|nr:DNA glycosylase [Clostridium algidicarnis]MBU3194397.1 8-oxoguanine DNA glycosylase [Clostridium algidicarnis]
MDYKNIESFDKGIIIKKVKNFNLIHIFDCGQCFRWDREENGNYIGVAFERVIELEKRDEDVFIYNTTEEEFKNIWEEYFDLQRDYKDIKLELSKDPLLKRAVNFGDGIRILRQEPFELTISFIISANNRIPMIKRAINNISSKWGKPIEYKGKTYYAFPRIEDLQGVSLEDIGGCSVGFRAKYIKDSVDKIYNAKVLCEKIKNEGIVDEAEIEDARKYDLHYIKSCDDDTCHLSLQNFSGIGPKVADCIMLFSMQKYSAFPVDVWVKRAMQHFYLAPDVSLKKIREFGKDRFNELSGFAQQYLFYYARENSIKM